MYVRMYVCVCVCMYVCMYDVRMCVSMYVRTLQIFEAVKHAQNVSNFIMRLITVFHL